MNGPRAIIGTDTSRDPLRGIDAHCKIGPLGLAIAGHHRSQPEPPQLMLHRWDTHDAATVADHHVDRFWRHLRRRHDEIAFIFAAFIIRHDDEPAGGNFGDCSLNRVERQPYPVAGRELEHQLGFETALDVDVEFAFREAFDEPFERFQAALSTTPERIALREIGETFVLPL